MHVQFWFGPQLPACSLAFALLGVWLSVFFAPEVSLGARSWTVSVPTFEARPGLTSRTFGPVGAHSWRGAPSSEAAVRVRSAFAPPNMCC